MTSIEGNILSHALINPPAYDIRANIQINVLNQDKIFLTHQGLTQHQTQFGLRIVNPSTLGLLDTETYNQNKFIDEILLACNLVLRRTIFTRKLVEIQSSKVQIQKPEAEESQVTKTNADWEVKLFEVVGISESVSIEVGTFDALDEQQVMETLAKLNNLKSKISNIIQRQDLEKSLNEYDAAMCSFDKLQIFKHLYNSIELATNCDGISRKSDDLDILSSSLSGTIQTDFENMREFYNRTKHIDRDSNDVQKYVQGLQDWLGTSLDNVRIAAQRIILHRLCQL